MRIEVGVDSELLVAMLALAALTLVSSGTVGWLWRRLDLASQLLPAQRERVVPWGGIEVVAAIFIWILIVGMADVVLTKSGWYDYLYGPEFVKRTDLLSMARRNLWALVMGVPFQVASIVLLFKAISDAQPYQFGLTSHRCGRNVLLGFVVWLSLTPPVLLIQVLSTIVYKSLFQETDQHGFQEMARSPSEWLLVLLGAAVAAPIAEEFLFRGVIQRFLMHRWWGGDVALAGAYVLAILSRWPGLRDAVNASDYAQLLIEAQPALFVLAMLAVYVVARRRWPSPMARTLYGVALLFAAAHSAVWPSPVPLFLLALGLGWLAQRTQSLVAPMVLHGLFNLVGVVLLLVVQSEEPAKGKAEMTPPARPAAVSTSSLVPGS